MVAAGAVVTRPVRPFELVGGVPARHLAGPGGPGARRNEHAAAAIWCTST